MTRQGNEKDRKGIWNKVIQWSHISFIQNNEMWKLMLETVPIIVLDNKSDVVAQSCSVDLNTAVRWAAMEILSVRS
ncbi:hypothetical protein SK128_025218 [Halocaridina rubra]|uniref:Uncharacterized protein n=1 Tax=Halocaridina rubra TaxID=373956 RepID=A0AAN8WLJ7_HALRR